MPRLSGYINKNEITGVANWERGKKSENWAQQASEVSCTRRQLSLAADNPHAVHSLGLTPEHCSLVALSCPRYSPK